MTQEERIAYYESILDIAEQKNADGQDASAELRELEVYYTGPLWKEDYAADEAGLLPKGLKRGVLSQDGIWNLLERAEDDGEIH